MDTPSLPIVDLDVYRSSGDSDGSAAEARKTAEALIEYGALIVRDSRVSEDANDDFLDTMEDYFAQEAEALEEDLRPEVHYQVGVTLENTEKPKCHSNEACQAVIAALDPEERPLDLQGGHADPKCRFFYRMGRSPPKTAFPALRMDNVIPRAFAATWQQSMETWGTQIQRAVEGVSEMLAEGLGLERETFLEAGRFGSHLLAPTATDLRKYGKEGSNLNFLTIHGRSRFPGLHIWARNSGKRISVKLPPGCLLVQAGKQLEIPRSPLQSRLASPSTASRPQIRISSTFFHHLSSDEVLSPRAFADRVRGSDVVKREGERLKGRGQEWEVERYEEGMQVGTLVENELKDIALHA
ncbi:hypothetical protein JCM8202v2_001698 [Rhodotorula sphaerocarpa]